MPTRPTNLTVPEAKRLLAALRALAGPTASRCRETSSEISIDFSCATPAVAATRRKQRLRRMWRQKELSICQLQKKGFPQRQLGAEPAPCWFEIASSGLHPDATLSRYAMPNYF